MSHKRNSREQNNRAGTLRLAHYFRSLLALKSKKTQTKPFSRKRDRSSFEDPYFYVADELGWRWGFKRSAPIDKKPTACEMIAMAEIKMSDSEKAAHIQGVWNHKTERMKSIWAFATKVAVTLIGAVAAYYVATTQLSTSNVVARVQQSASIVVQGAVSKVQQFIAWLNGWCRWQHGQIVQT